MHKYIHIYISISISSYISIEVVKLLLEAGGRELLMLTDDYGWSCLDSRGRAARWRDIIRMQPRR